MVDLKDPTGNPAIKETRINFKNTKRVWMCLKHTINCVPLITVGYVLLTLPEDTMRNRGYLRS